ncbi:MAG: hypothetical protein QXH00_06470 [Candidatus Jordarchaeales archaeon]
MKALSGLTPILKGGVRILRPCEYELLRKGAKKLQNQVRLDTLLLTGLRYVEAQRLYENPIWFDGKFIHLPEYAQKKAKRKQRERWVRLNPQGQQILPFFFKGPPLPSWKAWTECLKRWAARAGLDPTGLGPKTTRKTWESWLVTCYPKRIMEVFLSQGHTELTSLRHYLNLPFTEVDKLEMKRWTSGWI